MSDEVIARHKRTLRACWERGPGKAWEPPKGIKGIPFFDWAIREGFLRVVNGRCGFEIIPDSMVAWTEAGKMAMSELVS